MMGLSFREAFTLQHQLAKEGKHYIIRSEYRGSYYLFPYTPYWDENYKISKTWDTLLGIKK